MRYLVQRRQSRPYRDARKALVWSKCCLPIRFCWEVGAPAVPKRGVPKRLLARRALSTSAGSQPPSPPPLPAPNGPLLTRLRRPPSRSLPPIPSRAGAWEQTRRSRPPRGRPLVPPCDSTLLGGWSTSPESSPLVPSASSPCPRSPLPAVLAAELRSLARPITPSSSPALPQPRPARLFRCIPMHPPRLAPAGPPLPSDDEIVNTSTSLTSPRNGGAVEEDASTRVSARQYP